MKRLIKNNRNPGDVFSIHFDLPFKLLIIILIFGKFRPDRLIPGGNILMYFPVLILLFLLILWFQKSEKEIKNKQTKLMFCFGALLVVQLAFARNPRYVYEILSGFILFDLCAYLVRVQFVNTIYKLEIYIKLFVTLSIFFAVIGIIGKGRVNLPILGDENDFCLLMNYLTPFSYFLGQGSNKKNMKIFWYSTAGLFILANIASFSRGGFLGLLAVGLYLFYKSKKKMTAIIIILLLGVSVVIFAPKHYWQEMGTIATEGTEKGTGKQRIESWQAGWKMFLDYPIIGVGALNYAIWVPEYYDHYGWRRPNKMWGRVAHSLYFTLLPETGIIGTIIFFWILILNIKEYKYIAILYKNGQKKISKSKLSEKEQNFVREKIKFLYYASLGINGGLVAYLFTGAFISVLYYGYFWTLTSFYLILGQIGRKIEKYLIENSDFQMN